MCKFNSIAMTKSIVTVIFQTLIIFVCSLRNPSMQQLLAQSMSSRAPSGSSLPNSIPDSFIETGQQAGANNFSTSHSPVTTEAFQESSPNECKSNDAVLVNNSTSV